MSTISGRKGKTYEERLAEVGLLSLRERRKEIDMVQTFKIVRGIDEIEDMMEGRARDRPQTRQKSGMERRLAPAPGLATGSGSQKKNLLHKFKEKISILQNKRR